mmetsp:Transcript_10692/g.35477  ORF Transcript_10692/g.35477 Transcript_10692/m.35477 type:complete len:226 (-) Transcript_10692:236-913(-)
MRAPGAETTRLCVCRRSLAAGSRAITRFGAPAVWRGISLRRCGAAERIGVTGGLKLGGACPSVARPYGNVEEICRVEINGAANLRLCDEHVVEAVHALDPPSQRQPRQRPQHHIRLQPINAQSPVHLPRGEPRPPRVHLRRLCCRGRLRRRAQILNERRVCRKLSARLGQPYRVPVGGFPSRPDELCARDAAPLECSEIIHRQPHAGVDAFGPRVAPIWLQSRLV